MFITDIIPGCVVEFSYENWRGLRSRRRAQFISLKYGETEWHPDFQWIFYGLDLDKNEPRCYALRDMNIIKIYSS